MRGGVATTRSILTETSGNIAIMLALGLPVFFGGMAVAVDSASLYKMHGHMQSIADSAALSTAKEIHVYGAKTAELEAAGRDRVLAMLAQAELGDEKPVVDIAVDEDAGTARVDITMVGRSILPVEAFAENPIKVTAQARTYGEQRLCVLTLSPNAAEALRSKESGVLSAPECTVQSNSVDVNGILTETGGSIVSQQICSSGGVAGPANSYLPQSAQTDCPPLPDPLEGRAAPSVADPRCPPRTVTIRVSRTIYPGTYCGGITISGGAVVTAAPGDYVIIGGNLEVSGDATLRGENVSFYFAGDRAWFHFRDRSRIELSARKDGPLAGILFFEDRTAKPGRNFSIESGNVTRLIGTIYIPKGTLNIEAKGNIAADSAYTVIIARKLDLKAAKLVINQNFGLTDVPLPAGLKQQGGGQLQLMR